MISTESIRKQRKTLGILGGMGPAAGAEFYKRVVEHTEAHTDSEHIRTVLFGDCEIPDRTDYILGRNPRSPRESILSDIDALLSFGAEVIAVPCNTAEYFIDGHHFDATMLDIVCETVRFMQSKSIKTVGILSTDGTIASEIYSSKFHGCAVNIVYPSIAEQQKITDAIYKNVKSGLGGESGISDICHSLFWRGCDAVILGCTELSLLDMSKFDLLDRIFDPMDILAISSIKQCGYDSKGFDKKYDMV